MDIHGRQSQGNLAYLSFSRHGSLPLCVHDVVSLWFIVVHASGSTPACTECLDDDHPQ